MNQPNPQNPKQGQGMPDDKKQQTNPSRGGQSGQQTQQGNRPGQGGYSSPGQGGTQGGRTTGDKK